MTRRPPQPEIELTRALLDYQYGGQSETTRFWDDGLAVSIAAGSLGATGGIDPEHECRQLLSNGGLPPVAELVAERATSRDWPRRWPGPSRSS